MAGVENIQALADSFRQDVTTASLQIVAGQGSTMFNGASAQDMTLANDGGFGSGPAAFKV